MTSSHNSLPGLLHLESDPVTVWSESELAEILEHQLSAPLALDLGEHDARAAKGCFERARAWRAEPFSALLHQQVTDLELLVLVKEFAKAAAASGALPAPIAAVVYLLAISAALLNCNSRITEMSDQELRAKVEWALDQPWLDRASRERCFAIAGRLS